VKTLKSDALSVSSNLLTGSWRIASSHKVFRREILADQQSSRTLENQRAQIKHYSNTNRNESVTAQLLGYFSYKRFGWKICGLEFLANFYPEVALAITQELQIRESYVSQNFA
jgi:hypothetical protein